MPDLDLDAIEARYNAATEGPWTAEHTNVFVLDEHCNTVTAFGSTSIAHEERLANASYTAHMRTDGPALVARVRELEGALAFDKAKFGALENHLIKRIAALEVALYDVKQRCSEALPPPQQLDTRRGFYVQ